MAETKPINESIVFVPEKSTETSVNKTIVGEGNYALVAVLPGAGNFAQPLVITDGESRSFRYEGHGKRYHVATHAKNDDYQHMKGPISVTVSKPDSAHVHWICVD